jgi:hypothetical protein
MRTSTTQLGQTILDTLASGERRELSLVVGIRNALNRSGATNKGDLMALTKSGLRNLVASGEVEERDGLYSLSPHRSKLVRTASTT